MPTPRAPWWMYVVAASFLAFFCFNIYADVVAPEAPGFDAYDYQQGNLRLRKVVPGSALERAGLGDGDRILAVNGDPIRTLDDWSRWC